MHEVNLLAVLAAGIVPMVVGALWYGPLFGKRWLELMGNHRGGDSRRFQPVEDVWCEFLAGVGYRVYLGAVVRRDGWSRARRLNHRQERGRAGGRLLGDHGADCFHPPDGLPDGRL